MIVLKLIYAAFRLLFELPGVWVAWLSYRARLVKALREAGLDEPDARELGEGMSPKKMLGELSREFDASTR